MNITVINCKIVNQNWGGTEEICDLKGKKENWDAKKNWYRKTALPSW